MERLEMTLQRIAKDIRAGALRGRIGTRNSFTNSLLGRSTFNDSLAELVPLSPLRRRPSCLQDNVTAMSTPTAMLSWSQSRRFTFPPSTFCVLSLATSIPSSVGEMSIVPTVWHSDAKFQVSGPEVYASELSSGTHRMMGSTSTFSAFGSMS